MTFEELKKLALGSITVEELSQGLVAKLGEVSIAEATTLVEAAKLALETAIAEGDNALDARIEAIEASLATGDIHQAIEAIKTQVSGIEERLVTAEGDIDAIEADVAGFKTTTEQRFETVERNHSSLQDEVDALKSTIGGKNNATQVFATMEEFEEYSTLNQESLIKGDLAYVISVKKSYIYNPDAIAAKLDNPNPPAGWMFFDEISNEVDLKDYAKKAEVAAQLAEKAEKVHTHEMSEVTGLEAALSTKLEAADLADLEGKVTVLEGKVDVEKVSEAITAAVNPVNEVAQANKSAIEILNGGTEQVGSVDYKINEVKKVLDKVDTDLRADVDQAKEDILANAAEIAKLTAKNYILTRKQEVVDAVGGQTEYQLAGTGVSEGFVADVFVNSVRLVEGLDRDYTLEGKKLTLTKARSAGSIIQVVYTFVSNVPQV